MMRCLGRAAVESADFFDLKFRAAIITIVLVALGFLLLWRVRGTAETKEEFYKYFILVAAPTVLFLAGLFIYNVLRAPYLLYVDEYSKAQAKVTLANAAKTEAQGKTKTLEVRIGELEKQLSTKSTPALAQPHRAIESAKSTLVSLTDGQRFVLKQKLTAYKGHKISLMFIGHDPQMRVIFEQLLDIFKDSGWAINQSEIGQVGVVGANFPNGPYMTSTDVAAPIVREVFSVFSSIGIDLPLTPDAFGPSTAGRDAADIVIVIH
jgi:hypothetical protein